MLYWCELILIILTSKATPATQWNNENLSPPSLPHKIFKASRTNSLNIWLWFASKDVLLKAKFVHFFSSEILYQYGASWMWWQGKGGSLVVNHAGLGWYNGPGISLKSLIRYWGSHLNNNSMLVLTIPWMMGNLLLCYNFDHQTGPTLHSTWLVNIKYCSLYLHNKKNWNQRGNICLCVCSAVIWSQATWDWG